MKSSVLKRSIVVAGHNTSVGLEDEFWKALKEISRDRGMTLSDLLSMRIWIPMGAEEDAHYHVDRTGTESGGGGLSTCLRDLARFGEAIRNHGRFNGRQIVPSSSTT